MTGGVKNRVSYGLKNVLGCLVSPLKGSVLRCKMTVKMTCELAHVNFLFNKELLKVIGATNFYSFHYGQHPF